MKYLKIFPLLLLLQNLPALNYAQISEPHDNLSSSASSSPNASSSGSGTTMDVDLFTGAQQVGFSLFSYENKSTGLHHSISLNYKGGGIRTDDIASNAGLGWSLNAAPSITREVRGIPDDDLDVGYEVTQKETFATLDTARWRKISDNLEDGELDQYYYSTANGGGSFVIGKNGAIVQTPQTNTKIERSWLGGSRVFKITTPDGTKYLYRDISSTTMNYGESGGSPITTWYLSKIISAFDKDTIYFDYESHSIQYDASFTSLTYLSYFPSTGGHFEDNKRINTNVDDKRLTKIRYPNGNEVSLTYDLFPRLDLRTDNAVKSVTISNILSNSSYTYRFKYEYIDVRSAGSYAILPYQDYTGNSAYWNWSPGNVWNDNAENYFRLRLNNFHIERGADTLNGYTFGYSTDHLPPRGLDGTDDWGFYNASNSRVPTQGGTGSPIFPSKVANGYSHCDNLENIQLPTGGNIKYEFENNTTIDTSAINHTKYIGGVRVKSIIHSDGTAQSNNQIRQFRYVDEAGDPSGIVGSEPVYSFQYSETYSPSTANGSHPAAPTGYPVNYYPYDLVSYHAVSGPTANATYGYNVYSNAAQNSIQYFHGAPAGYSRVEEYEGPATHFKHKTVHKFRIQVAAGNSNFPFAPAKNVDYLNGLPLQTTLYNAAGLLEKKIENQYDVYPTDLNDTNFISVRVGLKEHPISLYGFDIANFYPSTGKLFLRKSVQTEYFTGNASMVTTTETVYDTAKMVPKIVRTSDAKEHPVESRYFYPYEFSATGAIATLQANGMIYAPVRTEIWKDTVNPKLMNAAVSTFQQVSGMVKQDASFGLTTTAPITAAAWGSFNSAQLLPAGQPFTQIAQMDQYDARGNLLQSTTKSTPKSIIWDYKSSIPVAEVINSVTSDIAYTSFEADGTGGWNLTSPYSVSGTDSFTGNKCISLQPGGTISKSGLDANKSYNLTFWCRQGLPTCTASGNTVALTTSDVHRGWTLYKAVVTGATGIVISNTYSINPLIDELRLYPVGAAMTTYTYDPLFGVTSVCDASNRPSYSQYDQFGRLLYQKDMDGNIIKAYDYKSTDPQ